MAQPYVGEIRMFAGNFAPVGWAFCNGQLAVIDQNETLFQLIGTSYGGDGQTTFGLPDLRGRVPLHFGNGFVQAQSAGTELVTLSVNQMPAHSHALLATTSAADTPNVQNAIPATGAVSQLYWGDPQDNTGNASAISPRGGSQPHDNVQPFLCISFIISLFGIFPSPT